MQIMDISICSKIPQTESSFRKFSQDQFYGHPMVEISFSYYRLYSLYFAIQITLLTTYNLKFSPIAIPRLY